MIIKLSYGQPRLKLRLVSDRQQVLMDDLKLVIREPDPDPVPPGCCSHNSVFVLEGCWPMWKGPMNTAPLPKPALIYPALNVDDDGYTVFQLDGKLNQWGPGRYVGTIVTQQGVVLDTLDLDLRNTPFVVDQVIVEQEADCA